MKKVFWILFVLSVFFVVPLAFAQTEQPPIVLPSITATMIGSVIAAALSLLLDYFPGVAAKYDALSVATKRQLAAVFAVVIVAVVFVLTCTKIVASDLVCTTAGAWDVIANVIYVFIVGQGVHAGTKPTPAFKANVLNIKAGKK